jgi:hypothetical protein
MILFLSMIRAPQPRPVDPPQQGHPGRMHRISRGTDVEMDHRINGHLTAVKDADL